jgi:hypothetical protein
VLEEAGRGRIDLELEVAVEVAGRDALREARLQLGGVRELDDALDLAAAVEPQGHRGDDSEEAVPAADEPEELCVLVARAAHDLAVGADEREPLDVADEGAEREPSTMRVRRDRAADAKVVGAGLLLPDRPARGRERVDESRPLDARLDLDEPALVVEQEDA